jgi:hypothetical protein
MDGASAPRALPGAQHESRRKCPDGFFEMSRYLRRENEEDLVIVRASFCYDI